MDSEIRHKQKMKQEEKLVSLYHVAVEEQRTKREGVATAVLVGLGVVSQGSAVTFLTPEGVPVKTPKELRDAFIERVAKEVRAKAVKGGGLYEGKAPGYGRAPGTWDQFLRIVTAGVLSRERRHHLPREARVDDCRRWVFRQERKHWNLVRRELVDKRDLWFVVNGGLVKALLAELLTLRKQSLLEERFFLEEAVKAGFTEAEVKAFLKKESFDRLKVDRQERDYESRPALRGGGSYPTVRGHRVTGCVTPKEVKERRALWQEVARPLYVAEYGFKGEAEYVNHITWWQKQRQKVKKNPKARVWTQYHLCTWNFLWAREQADRQGGVPVEIYLRELVAKKVRARKERFATRG